MNFGNAIEHIKRAGQAARAGWNGKGMFVYLNKGSTPGHVKGLAVSGVSTVLFEAGDADTIVRMPNVNLRAADGSTVTGWVASQVDMLADDWELL